MQCRLLRGWMFLIWPVLKNPESREGRWVHDVVLEPDAVQHSCPRHPLPPLPSARVMGPEGHVLPGVRHRGASLCAGGDNGRSCGRQEQSCALGCGGSRTQPRRLRAGSSLEASGLTPVSLRFPYADSPRIRPLPSPLGGVGEGEEANAELHPSNLCSGFYAV